MPHVITLTDLEVENVVIFKEPDVTPVELGMAINYTMSNSSGDRKGGNAVIPLTPAQKTQVVSFVKGHVQQLGTDLGLVIEDWAQP